MSLSLCVLLDSRVHLQGRLHTASLPTDLRKTEAACLAPYVMFGMAMTALFYFL